MVVVLFKYAHTLNWLFLNVYNIGMMPGLRSSVAFCLLVATFVVVHVRGVPTGDDYDYSKLLRVLI